MITDDEWEPDEFFLILGKEKSVTTEGIQLYNPDNDKEYPLLSVASNSSVTVADEKRDREFPRTAISNWLFIVPSDHPLNALKGSIHTPREERNQIIRRLNAARLQVNHDQSLQDLKTIEWAFETPLNETDRTHRHGSYQAVKKLENFPQHKSTSFRIGLRITENWASQSDGSLPADIIIHLAYYRRWTGDVEGALEASNCLKGERFRHDLTSQQRSILATERAAAFMDQFQKTGEGLADAKEFLKYSAGANNGNSSEENYLAWQRFNKLSGNTD